MATFKSAWSTRESLLEERLSMATKTRVMIRSLSISVLTNWMMTQWVTLSQLPLTRQTRHQAIGKRLTGANGLRWSVSQAILKYRHSQTLLKLCIRIKWLIIVVKVQSLVWRQMRKRSSLVCQETEKNKSMRSVKSSCKLTSRRVISLITQQ